MKRMRRHLVQISSDELEQLRAEVRRLQDQRSPAERLADERAARWALYRERVRARERAEEEVL